MAKAATATNVAPGSNIPTAPIAAAASRGQTQRVVPFREATIERTTTLTPLNYTLAAAFQPIETTLDGTGYVYEIVLDVQATATSNAATVAFAEDAPYNVLANVAFSDPTGSEVNLQGYNLNLYNQFMGATYRNLPIQNSNLFSTTAGVGSGAGGSFSFMQHVPVGINRRDLLGILGNNDRMVKYQLRTDINASGQIYTTAPTNQPNIIINRYYNSYAVPPAAGPAGPQQLEPDYFGTIAYGTQSTLSAVPAPGQVNHALQRIGNTMRFLAFVFRSNGARSAAETNAPTALQLIIGDTYIANESWRLRKMYDYEHYGFNMDNGVIVYDWIHDFLPGAGDELGNDWINTSNVNIAQLVATYPSGFGSTNNSLIAITADMELRGQPLGS